MDTTDVIEKVEKLSINIAKILKKLDKPGINTSKADIKKTNKPNLGISKIKKEKSDK